MLRKNMVRSSGKFFMNRNTKVWGKVTCTDESK